MEGFYSSHATRETAADAALVTRPVRLGLATVNGIWPFATHWAVQVEDTWFEVAGASKEEQHGQSDSLAVPQLGSCTSSGSASRLSAARRSQVAVVPQNALPLPWLLELPASKAVDLPAFDRSGEPSSLDQADKERLQMVENYLDSVGDGTEQRGTNDALPTKVEDVESSNPQA